MERISMHGQHISDEDEEDEDDAINTPEYVILSSEVGNTCKRIR